MILWISIFMIVIFTFTIEHRYQKWLFVFVIILLLLHIGCIIAQALITLHCLFNLKFISSTLDYSKESSCFVRHSTFALASGSWSAIAAAAGTVVSTVLLDCIFMWPRKCRSLAECIAHFSGWKYLEGRVVSSRINPLPTVDHSENRATSPVDSVILQDFHRHPEAAAHQVYSNTNRTRHFRILPTNERRLFVYRYMRARAFSLLEPNGVRRNVLQLRHLEDKNKKHSIPTESET